MYVYGYNIINYCTCVRNEFGLMFLKKDGDIVEVDIWGKVEAWSYSGQVRLLPFTLERKANWIFTELQYMLVSLDTC